MGQQRFFEALRKKFSSPQEVMRALDMDPALLYEGDNNMARRYGRDQEPDIEEILKMIDQLDEEGQTRVYGHLSHIGSADALHRRGGRDDLYEQYREPPNIGGWAGEDRRRGARDMPPEFEGVPRGGAADPETMRRQQEYDKKVSDRRRRGLGADSMYGLGPRPTSALESNSFHAMFPQARRIGFLG